MLQLLLFFTQWFITSNSGTLSKSSLFFYFPNDLQGGVITFPHCHTYGRKDWVLRDKKLEIKIFQSGKSFRLDRKGLYWLYYVYKVKIIVMDENKGQQTCNLVRIYYVIYNNNDLSPHNIQKNLYIPCNYTVQQQ